MTHITSNFGHKKEVNHPQNSDRKKEFSLYISVKLLNSSVPSHLPTSHHMLSVNRSIAHSS